MNTSTIDSLRDFFAAMPPLSALKFLFGMAVTSWIPDVNGTMRKQAPKCIAIIDVRNAYFWAKATRKIYVELPEEAGYDKKEVCWRIALDS